MAPCIDLLLLDVDGVLLDHHRTLRVRHLADALGRSTAQVQHALFESGLERQYDRGALRTGDYLQRFGERLQTAVSEAQWIRARLASSRVRDDVLSRVVALPAALPLGVLTNNGPLMVDVLHTLLPALRARLEGRVLCSGALGARKPDPAVFLQAMAILQATPARTLFVDDLFTHVRGARQAGLQAETVRDGRSLGRVLKRYGLG